MNTYQNPLHIVTLSSDPASPPAGYIALYTKSDGNVYMKDASGNVLKVSLDPNTVNAYTKAQYVSVTNESSVSGTKPWDAAANPDRVFELVGATTISNPSNANQVQSGTLTFIQDATGGRTVSWDTNFVGRNGADIPAVDTTANAVTIIFYVIVGTKVYLS